MHHYPADIEGDDGWEKENWQGCYGGHSPHTRYQAAATRGAYHATMQEPKDVAKKLAVLFTPSAMERLVAYVKSVDGEIGGFGVAESMNIDPENPVIIIKKVFIVRQMAGGAHVNIDPEALLDTVEKMMVDGIAGETNPGLIKLWFHCHPGTSISADSWSGVDEWGINQIGANDVDWFVSVLSAGNGSEMTARLDIFKPVRCTFNGVKVGIVPHIDEKVQEEVEKEIAELVTGQAYGTRTTTVSSHHGQPSSHTGVSHSGGRKKFGNATFVRRDDDDEEDIGGSSEIAKA